MDSTQLQTAPRRSTLFSYLELMRPANIVTAFADILAGFAAAGGLIVLNGNGLQISPDGIGWLLLSTFGLYGGGVVFNDIFDAGLDAEERPERAIPSGRVSKTGAVILGILLFIAGVFFAFQVHMVSGLIALFITIFALSYDKWAKHSTLWGPLFMGSCRGGNLLLGVSVLPAVLAQIWVIALIPVAYIGAITLISHGEVHGGSRKSGIASIGLIILVILGLAGLTLFPGYQILTTLPFFILFAAMVLPPFTKAARIPKSDFIRKAVKRGILSLIILNSTIAAGFAGFTLGIVVLLLLPLSLLLSKLFAVT